ncbi:MAG: energy transducer TonB, partial [Hymenobacteraceae bacterium]|nr:energy transducer TonB [Hymenobacteraceae bacterium]
GIKLDHTKLKKTVGPGSELDYMDAATFNLQNKAILAKLSEAAAAAVKATSGQWEPARKNGQPLAAELALPVQFLSEEAEQRAPAPATQPANSQETSTRKPDFNQVVPLYKLDQKPGFKSGEAEMKKFFAKNIRYPKTDAEGDVTISFIVHNDGSIGKISVSKSMGVALKEEVLRVAEQSRGMWQAGIKDGKPVNTVQMLTFRFVIQDGSSSSSTKAALPADVVITKYGREKSN